MKKMCIALMGMLLLSLAGPAMAAADEKEISKLRVEGEGKVRVAPDMATIVLGVESRSTKAAEAVEENARLMNQTSNPSRPTTQPTAMTNNWVSAWGI